VDCNESLRLQPGEGGALNARGTAYLKLDRLDLARADFDTALRTDPKNAFSLYGRGIAKGLKGDRSGADADIAAAKQISPDIAADFERYGVSAVSARSGFNGIIRAGSGHIRRVRDG